MVQLSEVFGIKARVPEHTYVNRNNLDERFSYYLTTDRHVVIYGGSKQGKTILRKKNLSEKQTVVVNCRQGQVVEQIYLNILNQLGVHIDAQVTKSLTLAGKAALEAEVDAGFPFIGRLKGKVTPEGSVERAREVSSQPVGVDPQHLEYIAKCIRDAKKRIVLEDFHYLSEQQQRRIAFDLKGFWDNHVFMIIVGIWEEDNLLTYYNGDLSGRVEEIDVEWKNEELQQLLNMGCKALNIKFSDEIEVALIDDSNRNVGLLQQLSEKLCFTEHIYDSGRGFGTRAIAKIQSLEKVRMEICSDLSSRYRKFYEAMKQGFEEDQHEPYGVIVRACAVEISSEDLSKGLGHKELLSAIKKVGGAIAPEALQTALSNLNRLQVQQQIYPMVLYYNLDMRKLQLADKEFLFYRQHCQPHWD